MWWSVTIRSISWTFTPVIYKYYSTDGSKQLKEKQQDFSLAAVPTLQSCDLQDNNVRIIDLSHGSWKERWRLIDGTSMVTFNWRRLLSKKAWETAKQALPLCHMPLFFLPRPVLFLSWLIPTHPPEQQSQPPHCRFLRQCFNIFLIVRGLTYID